MSLEKLEAESEDNKAFPSFIPVTWFSSDKTRFLYPPKNSEKDKSGPVDWANRVFARHYYPKSSWEEHDVKEIIIDKPKAFLSIWNKFKAILIGRPSQELTDSDVPRPRFRKRVREKQAEAEKSHDGSGKDGAKQTTSEQTDKSIHPTTPFNGFDEEDAGMSTPELTTNIPQRNGSTVAGQNNEGAGMSTSEQPAITPQRTGPAIEIPNEEGAGKLATQPTAINHPPTAPTFDGLNIEEGKITASKPADNNPQPSAPTINGLFQGEAEVTTPEQSAGHPQHTGPTVDVLNQEEAVMTAVEETTNIMQSFGPNGDSRDQRTDKLDYSAHASGGGGGGSSNTDDSPPPKKLVTDDMDLRQHQHFGDSREEMEVSSPSESEIMEPQLDGNEDVGDINNNSGFGPSSISSSSFATPMDRQIAPRISQRQLFRSPNVFPNVGICQNPNCKQVAERLKKVEESLDQLNNTNTTLINGQSQLVAAVQKLTKEENLRMSSDPVSLLQYHRNVVQRHFTRLPLDSLQKVYALHTALGDNNLAVSVIAVLVAEYRTASSNNDFGYSIFFHLVAGTVCEDIQWKSGSRGEDNRQGLSCLSNLTSVLGAAILKFSQERRTGDVSTAKIIDLLQVSRKNVAKAYRKYHTPPFSKEDLTRRHREAVPVYTPTVKPTDREIVAQLDKSTQKLLQALDSFTIPAS